MTPKEKALSIYDRMVVDFTIDKEQSKECALVCADELLEYANSHGFIELKEFYKEVKKEIQKI